NGGASAIPECFYPRFRGDESIIVIVHGFPLSRLCQNDKNIVIAKAEGPKQSLKAGLRSLLRTRS
ncbi:MAG: hypothetical protein Q8O01_05660, partial [Candidatus Omnitrophota bacterium]|nr:hypothetical protein [Candidatus Omnitrophota bacterium]